MKTHRKRYIVSFFSRDHSYTSSENMMSHIITMSTSMSNILVSQDTDTAY